MVVGEYEYDENNNIKKITSGGTVKEYSYDSLNRLSDDNYVYDAMGNPTTYKGNTFVWQQGRKLVSGYMNGKSFSYAYDGNGMRFKKTVNGVKTQYYYDGTQFLMESKNGKGEKDLRKIVFLQWELYYELYQRKFFIDKQNGRTVIFYLCERYADFRLSLPFARKANP